MACGPEIGALARRDREPERVVDRPVRDLVVADEPGEDGKAGGVRRRERVRAKRVRPEVPRRARARGPASALLARMRGEQLVELARSRLNEQHVPVAVALRAALDRRVGWNRIRARIALVRVAEGDWDTGLRRRDGGVRDPVR